MNALCDWLAAHGTSCMEFVGVVLGQKLMGAGAVAEPCWVLLLDGCPGPGISFHMLALSSALD